MPSLPALLRRDRKSETNLRRRSVVLEYLNPSKAVEHHEHPRPSATVGRPSPYPVPPGTPETLYHSFEESPRPSSESFGPSSSVDASNDHLSHPPLTQPRYTLMRSRHASDSELSTRAKQAPTRERFTPPSHTQPPTPAIMTTAPTIDVTQKARTKRPRLKIPDRLRVASERKALPELPHLTSERSRSEDKRGLTLGPDGGSGSRVTFNAPTKRAPRASGEPPPYGDESHSSLALPISRLSESSRSEGSAGETVGYATTTTTHTVSTTTTFFRLPTRPNRRKKAPTPLFPLPDKVHSSNPSSVLASTPRVSTTIAVDSVDHSPARTHSACVPGSASPPLPSPSLGQPMSSSTSSGGRGYSLGRKNSTTSARSVKSSPSRNPLRLGGRGRSSTGAPEPSLPTPSLPSARTSTSTAGRPSLGGLFGISQRHRLEPDSPFPRSGSPITPRDAASQANSLHLVRDAIVIPEREADDTPGKYLGRLEAAVSRGAVASILSKSSDAFHQAVLRSHMRSFAFFEDPMDMAIRKLLMEVELPKETQQIDRVLQSFADRYHECNPGIYASPDQAYFIAFSLLILHTDVFNKNNKHKMMKPDYLKNTKGEGVSDDVLECFYDNISYTPFIHVEDELDSNGDRLVAQKARKGLFPRGGAEGPKKTPKGPVDPYTLIIDHKLDSLRPNIKEVILYEDPFGYLGTATALDLPNLQRTFFRSGILQIVSARSRPDAFMSPTTISNPAGAHPGVVDIKITKVGVLWRKEMTKKKKARSPWQEWGAILTGSQLYFFRNTGWVRGLMHQYEAHHKYGLAGSPVTFKPPLENFKPDALMSTHDAVALVDSSYRKHKNAFVLVQQGGFAEVFLADNERDMNDWLAKLNYAAAFRTAGVRMRAVVGGRDESREVRRSRAMRLGEDTEVGRAGRGSSDGAAMLGDTVEAPLAQQIWDARRQIMRGKIEVADAEISTRQKRLDGLLRDARHLQILAPIQAKSKETVLLAAMRMGAQLLPLRLEIWRMKCHRDILAMDLADDLREAGQGAGARIPASPPSIPQRDSSVAEALRVDSRQSPSKRILRSSNGQSPPQRATPTKEHQHGLDDIFQTPPELARKRSHHQTHAAWELPPLSFGSGMSRHVSSTTSNDSTTSTDTAIAAVTDREVSDGGRSPEVTGSASASASAPVSVSAQAPATANLHSSMPESIRMATRCPSVDIDEISVLQEAGIVAPTVTSSSLAQVDGGSDPEDVIDGSSIKATEQRNGEVAEVFDKSKAVRRSLHRPFRDAHTPAHQRSKKGRDRESISSGVNAGEDAPGNESEGLARGTGSFTVHGKKASVITFGREWHGMSPEERLRTRRQTQAPNSALSMSTETAESEGGTEPGNTMERVAEGMDSEWRASKAQGLVARYEHGRRSGANICDLNGERPPEETEGVATTRDLLRQSSPSERQAVSSSSQAAGPNIS